MLSLEVGQQRLQLLAKEAEAQGLFQRMGKQLELEVEVNLIGYDPPSQELMTLFNRTIPLVQLASSNAHTFLLRCIATKLVVEGNHETERPIETAVPRALEIASRFLTALAIASNGIVTWRRLDLSPLGMIATWLDTGKQEDIQFQRIDAKFQDVSTLHAGHLCAALDIHGYLFVREWSDRFFELYQKGDTLLAFPLHPLANFLDEAYLCYFRCLEYVTMVKILNGGGGFDEKKFVKACNRVYLELESQDGLDSPELLLQLAKALVRERGTGTAHMAKGSHDTRINQDQAYQLKKLVNKLVQQYTLAWMAGKPV